LEGAFAKGTKLGLFFGFSQLFFFFTFALIFYFGALVMRDNPDISLTNILAPIYTIITAGWYTGNNFYFMPDIGAGKQAAGNLFKILDSEDEDQIQIAWGSKLQKSTIEGNIEFRGV
jgi:ABC-type multidrug transport system fused ATPase/permease subunit